MSFEINNLFREGLPAPVAARFSGYPKYNFVGGHNDNDGIPIDDFIAAMTRSLKAEGKKPCDLWSAQWLPGVHAVARTYREKAGPNGRYEGWC